MPDTKPVNHDCPYCGAGMAVTRMACEHCDISIDASFPMSRLGRLPVEHQRFIEMFLLAGGNLKEIAEHAGVSYPTVRSRLDKVIDSLRSEIAKTRTVNGTMLDALSSGRKSDEAARMIKEI